MTVVLALHPFPQNEQCSGREGHSDAIKKDGKAENLVEGWIAAAAESGIT